MPTIQSAEYIGRWGQRAGLSAAKEARGKAATNRIDVLRSGRWGI